nr:chaperone HtpG [uncultured Capnocytophaga sp.]
MIDSCNFDVNKEISIFIDTKNYSTATNMFKDLGQYKAYLREINNFDQLYIIQQGGRNITKELVVRRLQSAIKKEINDVFEIIWKNENLRTILFNNSKREKALKDFTNSIDNKSYKLFDSILITK